MGYELIASYKQFVICRIAISQVTWAAVTLKVNVTLADDSVIDALKQGLREAQRVLTSLNMAPSREARNRKWFVEPWTVEAQDKAHMGYVPPCRPILGEDGDGEVLQDQFDTMDSSIMEVEPLESIENADESCIISDQLDSVAIAENEMRDVIVGMLDPLEVEDNVLGVNSGLIEPINAIVHFEGNVIYKSTLVSQLNGNSFLSKDRLTRVQNSIYFNHSADYCRTVASTNICLLGLRNDCRVYFFKTLLIQPHLP